MSRPWISSTLVAAATIGTVVAMFVLTWNDEAVYSSTMTDLVSPSTLFDVTLTGAAIASVALAWFAPRPAAWITLAALNPLVSRDLENVVARWMWLPLLALLVLDLSVRTRARPATPGSLHPAASRFESRPSRARQGVAVVAVGAALLALVLWSNHRTELTSLQERATATTGKITEIDAEYDEVTVAIGGTTRVYLLADVAEIQVGDPIAGYTDPRGEFPPFVLGDPDPDFLTWTDSLIGPAAALAVFAGAVPWVRRRRTERAATAAGLPVVIRGDSTGRSMLVLARSDNGELATQGLLVRPFAVGTGSTMRNAARWDDPRRIDDEELERQDGDEPWWGTPWYNLTGGMVCAEPRDAADAELIGATWSGPEGSHVAEPLDLDAVLHTRPDAGAMVVVDVDGTLWASAQPFRDPFTVRHLAHAIRERAGQTRSAWAQHLSRRPGLGFAVRATAAALLVTALGTAGWFIAGALTPTSLELGSHVATGFGLSVVVGRIVAALTPAVEVHRGEVHIGSLLLRRTFAASAVRTWNSGVTTVTIVLDDPERRFVIGPDVASSTASRRRLDRVRASLKPLDRAPRAAGPSTGTVTTRVSPAVITASAAMAAYLLTSTATWAGLLPGA